MSRPRITAVVDGSPAARAGLGIGDEIVSIDGEVPRDVIQWQMLVDEPDLEIVIDAGGLERTCEIEKAAGEPLGVEVDAALFDRVQTCDNHCPFCFIYQLPKGMRRSLYLKDDDYRLSFLYGNFTTLTRFTEADLERVISENLSPLYVSIHATDPVVRAELLRNRRGGLSLRWLRVLLDHDIEVHGQIVVCPGVNDADVLDDTLCGVLDEYPEIVSVAVVPLGVSQFSDEATMRQHTTAEAEQVVDIVESWQATFLDVLGRRMVFASDEYYLLCDRPFPDSATYGDFDMHEDGIGMARAFEAEFDGSAESSIGIRSGFFHAVDGAPKTAWEGGAVVAREIAPAAENVAEAAGGGRAGARGETRRDHRENGRGGAARAGAGRAAEAGWGLGVWRGAAAALERAGALAAAGGIAAGSIRQRGCCCRDFEGVLERRRRVGRIFREQRVVGGRELRAGGVEREE